MAAVDVQRFDLFLTACRLLQRYRQRTSGFHPVGFEVALAIQYYRTQMGERSLLPWVGQGEGMPIEQVATQICDPFYRKDHPHLPGSFIWPIFNQGEDGVIRPLLPSHHNGTTTEWRWIKACNSQQGIGCHAIAHHLWQDEEFLGNDRDLCPFRLYDGKYPFTVDQGRQTCGFDAHPCGWESGFPKMLQILGKGKESRVLQTRWTPKMWQMLVPPDHPIPVYPLMVALAFGHAHLGQGGSLTPAMLQENLGFSDELFQVLFDLNPDAPLNQEFLTGHAVGIPNPEEVSFLLPPRSQPTGGKVILDPDEPPKFQSSGVPAGGVQDPLLAERRRRRQLERTPHHNEILRQFRRWFRLAGLEVREDPHYFDFLAVGGNRVLLAEVKLLYQRDMAEGIQEVVGQLLYYEYFTLNPWREHGYQICKAAVFDHPPFGEYIDFLADLGIFTYWLTEDHAIDGREESLRLLRQMEVQVRPDPEFPD